MSYWQIRTRRPHPVGSPWSSEPVGVSDVHPGMRRALTRTTTRAGALIELARDDWREVRLAALLNPAAPRSLLADRARSDSAAPLRRVAEQVLDGQVPAAAVCVECGASVKNPDFSTCSVRCSIEQYERRCRSGRWVDAVEADFRHRYGLRRAWPSQFVWDVATAPGSGGIPGAGPKKRVVLVSFVAGISSGALVELLRSHTAVRPASASIALLLGADGIGSLAEAETALRMG